MRVFLFSIVLSLLNGVGNVYGSDEGTRLYQRCQACHAFEHNRTGPAHCDLFGRVAGSLPGYSYTSAMRQSGLVWNETTLDLFLTAPLKVVPGTTMAIYGIEDANERKALIDYLRLRSRAASCLKEVE